MRNATTLYDDYIYSVENCPYYISTADVVEVVRCKDCKMATEDILLEGFYLCEKDLMLYGADHFCNYGERKGD